MTQIPIPSHEDVPVGAILPFKADEVPDTFEVFDGRVLTLADNFDLVRELERQRSNIESYWEEMGGARIKRSAWRMPNLDEDQVWTLLALPKIKDDVVLAIKARRN
jgi:hypothetical protein